MNDAQNAALDVCQALLSDISRLFEDMDREYERVAARFGFQCTGCVDNCCRSLFFHHTLAEWLHLRAGIARLDLKAQSAMKKRAAMVNQQMARHVPTTSPPGLMCPANVDGACRLYPFRPMICRLHGIPNVFRLPNGNRLEGPGCEAFIHRPHPKAGDPMDRTPFYQRLAVIEKTLRERICDPGKIKLTVSQMIEHPPLS